MTVTIHNADATKGLPFVASGTIQTVFTSPPYWGLRDYGLPPSIMGGDQACEHEWGATVRSANANAQPGPGGRKLNAYQDVAREGLKTAGAFCQRCDAWRGQLGLEPTPELYVAHLVGVFREVARTLRDDGTLWLNIGDSYATGAGKVGEHPGGGEQGARWTGESSKHDARKAARPATNGRGEHQVQPTEGRKGSNRAQRGDGNGGVSFGPMVQPNRLPIPGLKPKDLVGIPWRLAFALQADGWYLRSDIIWHKPNPMPESVTDRPTKAHEYLFLLTKSERYYYDAAAISEPIAEATVARLAQPALADQAGSDRANGGAKSNGAMKAVGPRFGGDKYGDSSAEEHRTKSGNEYDGGTGRRNRRTVWTISTRPFKEAHFATCPPELVEPCIRAGSRPGDTVLDIFGGAGTTGLVADRLGRDAVLVEMGEPFVEMARRRINGDSPLFSPVANP